MANIKYGSSVNIIQNFIIALKSISKFGTSIP